MTSNAGSNLNTNSIGFGNAVLQNTNKMIDALKSLFRPEFLNRVDEIIPFNGLTENELLQIIDLLIAQTQKALNSKEMKLEINENAKKFLLSKGTDLKYGARPLRRTIQRYVEDVIADKILRNELISGQTISISANEDITELIFTIQ